MITQYVLRFLEMMANHSNHNVQFYFLVKPFTFIKRKELKLSIVELFKLETKKFDTLKYIFCSDAYLLEMNNTFLQHDYFTDILTFDLSSETFNIIGEIYISVDRVKENARQLNEAFYIELRRVMFHGALHLCGYKDKTKKDKILMRRKEDYYLSLFK